MPQPECQTFSSADDQTKLPQDLKRQARVIAYRLRRALEAGEAAGSPDAGS